MTEKTHLKQNSIQPILWTSAGVPVPDFEKQTDEEMEEYAWRFKVYEENFINPYIEALKQKYDYHTTRSYQISS